MKKKLLSLLLCLCMVLTLLPTTTLAVNTVPVSDEAGLRSAIANAVAGDTIAIDADFSIRTSVVISKQITLDLGSHTLTYDPSAASICLRFTAGGTITGSGALTGGVPGSMLVHNAGGTLTILGGTLSATGAQSRAVQNDGTLQIAGGTVESAAGYAVLNNGTMTVTDGAVTTNTGVGVLNYAAAARLTLSGGTVSTTSTAEANTFAAYNNAVGAEITVEGGSTVTAGSGFALGNLNGGKITVNGGEMSAVSGNTILNDGDSTTAVHGGTVSTTSGSALMNYGNLLVDGGEIQSNTSLALCNLAKGGTSVTLSGGSLISSAYTAVNNQGSGDILLSGSTVAVGGTSPAVVNFSTGTVTVERGAITAVGSIPTFYNVSNGVFSLSGGTYYGVYNADTRGKTVIDGGSIYTFTGTAPVNSAGDVLQKYAIQLAGVGADTAVSGSDLTFTPAVSYGFTDVRTDANSYLYLWLPTGITSATYKTDKVDIAGSVTGGSESTLPNANFTVSVYLDGKLWTDCPAAFRPILRPASGGLSTYPGPSDTGVFSYAGMDGTTTYQIWGKAALGQAAFEGVAIGNGATSARVDYYTLTTVKGSGVSFVYPLGTLWAMKGAKISISCTPEDGLTFEKWTDADGNTVSDKNDFETTMTDGPRTYTATAKIQPYTATVTVNKDDKTWTDYEKSIVLSPSSTDVNAEGAKSVSAVNGVCTFPDLTQTYYIWVDGKYTSQTVTSGSNTAAVDYYTVTLRKGDNIESFTIGGTTYTGTGPITCNYRKGESVTFSATPKTDCVFSRWNDQAGAIYSTNAEATTSNVTAPINLTAVGASTKYTATVTVQKDGVLWTDTPRSLVLSTSPSTNSNTTGTVSEGKYTFADLDGTKTYYVWDAVTDTYTGMSVSAGDSTANVTLDYYTVTVTKGESITSISGDGVYRKGSSVTLTATPQQYYAAKWSDNSTGTVKRIANLAAQTAYTVTGTLDTYTGTVTVKKDGGTWTDFSGTVTLSTDKDNAETGKVAGTSDKGVITFADLDPRTTYYVWVDGTFVGQTMLDKAATVSYCTVSVTESGVADIADQVVLAAGSATFTAAPIGGFDFMGWFDSDGKLLSTSLTYTVTGVNKATTLTAKASDKFDAVITIKGAIDRIITLKSGSDNAVSVFTDLDRTKTYKVFDNGTDTRFTVSKNAPEVTLQYYTVILKTDTNTGIDNVTGNGTYLAGNSVTIDANVKAGNVFGSWTEDGGTVLSTQKIYTIPAISRDYSLTAKTALSFSGTVNITSGNIVIEDDPNNVGKIRITVGGVTMTNGDNLDPNTNISITGGTADAPASNNITVTTQYNVMMTLDHVNISAGTALWMTGSGTLTVDLAGENHLTSNEGWRSGIHMGKDNAWPYTYYGQLVLQSSSGDGSLTATGGQYAAGIGCYLDAGATITINSGTVHGIGGTGGGAGIGCGGQQNRINITINGGTVTGTSRAAEYPGIGGDANVTINGGVVTGASTNGYGIGASDKINATVTINGGNIIGTVSTTSKTSGTVTAPKNAKGEFVYQTTFSTGASAITDVSKTLTIRDKNGTVYGMNDVKTDAAGKVYAYLPADTAGAVYDGKDYGAFVKNDGSGVFTETKYHVDVPASATLEGVTASGTLRQVIPEFVNGTTVEAIVNLSGTAIKQGTYTVGLTGTKSGAITNPGGALTKHVEVGEKPTNSFGYFSFTMPATAVDDLTVNLSFAEDDKYTVTYSAPEAIGGSIPAGGNYYKNQKYTVDSTTQPTRTGYTFVGWSMNGTDIISGEQTMGPSNVTLAAKWTPGTYQVTFHANNGTGSMDSQTFAYGTAQPLTANAFNREGYSFLGWATSADGEKIYNNKNTITVTKDTDLYALWSKESHMVSFDGNGANSDSTMTPQPVPNNTLTALTANSFIRTGYVFGGWNTQADGNGTAYANGASLTTDKDVTLYAQWTANICKVQFIANGASSGSTKEQTFAYNTPQNLTINGFVRTGYTFAGWNTQVGGNGTAYANEASLTTDKDVTLYAQWTANTYKVQFDANNGTGTMPDQRLTYDATTTPLAKNKYLRNGYVLTGWNTQANGTGTAYADESPVRNLTADKDGSVTLYAQWGAASFTVNFDKNGGVGSMGNQSFQTGDTAALKSSAFSKTGYTFTGWNTQQDGNGTNYAAGTAVNKLALGDSDSITLYAQWAANTYKVQFNANGAIGSMGDQGFAYDEAPKELTANTFAKTGYTFLGWAESPVSTSAEYADEQPVQNLTPMNGGVITLYAVWKANTVSVVFDGNGADNNTMPNQSFDYNTAQELSQNTYTRQGYNFAGWNTQSNGRGVSYADQQQITNPVPDISGSLTLYAQWQEQSRYGLSGLVKTDGDPAGVISGATITLKQGDKVLAVTKSDANGNYSFTNLLPGSYNVVCTYDGKTVTKAAAVVNKPVAVPFTVSSTAKNSLLELEKETGVSVPALVVDGLSDVADAQVGGQITTVKLTVTAKARDEQNSEQSAIQQLTKEQTIGMYLDAKLTCNGASIGDSNNAVLKILIPYDFSAKTALKVLRYHDTAATELTELKSLPESAPTDGTWYPDVTGGQIIVYASKFSTYAVSYTPVSNTNGGSGSTGSTGGSAASPIVIGSVEHGKLTANKTTATAGAEVIITAKPDSGYGLHHLIVTDADGKAIVYNDKGDGTYTFAMPKSKTTVSAKFVKQSENPFTDITDGVYYYDAVLWAVEKGITSGASATTFNADGICTRAQTVTFLWRAMGSPEPTSKTCPFTDVKTDSYSYKAVLWATEKGITKGTSKTAFSPDMTVTRSQTVTFLWRTAGNPVVGTVNPFTDVASRAYYYDAVLWAVKENITSGTGSTTFSPMDGCSRAQIVTFLYRCLNK